MDIENYCTVSLFFEQVSPISMRCTSASIPYGLIWLNSALNVQDFPISKLTPNSVGLNSIAFFLVG
ncbi:hypothetical protein JZL89_19220 [Providencia rettgeri]|nr:hypothetical protein [Providencia rettgeri]